MKVYNMDDLALLETFELEHMENRFKDQIRHARRSGSSTDQLEVELSYVQRELHIRDWREAYLENMHHQGFQSEIGV